jgi:hypothetical protein
MKRLIVFAMLGIAAISATPAKAQVSVNINIGSQPDWGPRGYDYVDYYYLPEVESYYYVPTRKFIYYSGGNWVHTRNLPHRYRNYNLHSGRKVVINGNRPYLRHHDYKKRYARNYSSNHRRVAERTSYHKSNSKHYRNNDKHYRKNDKNWSKGNNKHNKGRDYGRGNDRGDHGRGGRQ